MPLGEEGAGNAGCSSHTHSLMYGWKKYMSLFTTGPAVAPTFPAQWFDGLCRARPGETGFCVTVA
jgi:hypothetical protein